MQKECFIFRLLIKIHGQLCKMSIFVKFAIIFSRFKKWPRKIYSHLLSLRFASNTRFMYIYELMMTEWSQFVISMGSKYSKVGINNLACRLCSKWCQTFGGRCIHDGDFLMFREVKSLLIRKMQRLLLQFEYISTCSWIHIKIQPMYWLFLMNHHNNANSIQWALIRSERPFYFKQTKNHDKLWLLLYDDCNYIL